MRDRGAPGPLVWTNGKIQQLAADAVPSVYAAEQRVLRKAVAVDGSTGWGQFVDDRNWTEGQWGLLGTSAAVQVLSRPARLAGQPMPPAVIAAVALLPQDTAHVDQRLADKVRKGDLQNIYRLATVAEALVPERDIVPAGQAPPLIAFIEGQAAEGHAWHPQSAKVDPPDAPGNAVTTAFVLHALRRFDDPPGRFPRHREWLAEQVLGDRRLWRRPDYVALAGLALLDGLRHPHPDDRVVEAVAKCREELLAWRNRERSLVVDRPIVHPYNLGTSTDYLILNPEVMAALFFARHPEPPQPSRRFILDVSRIVADNIDGNDGFEGQVGAMTTVDQEWAARLLTELRTAWDDPVRRRLLRPSIIASPRVILGLVAALVFVGLTVVALFATQDPGVVAVLFVTSVVIGLITVIWGESRQKP